MQVENPPGTLGPGKRYVGGMVNTSESATEIVISEERKRVIRSSQNRQQGEECRLLLDIRDQQSSSVDSRHLTHQILFSVKQRKPLHIALQGKVIS